MLVGVFWISAASEEIHHFLYGIVRAFDIAGEVGFLGQGRRQRLGQRDAIWVEKRLVLKRLLAETFAGLHHLVRRDEPVRLARSGIQRKHRRARLALVYKVLPEGIDGDVQGQLVQHVLAGQVVILEIDQQLLLNDRKRDTV